MSQVHADTLAFTKARHARCPGFDLDTLDTLGVPLRKLVTDSRRVKPHDIFVAYQGETQDGRSFISQAIASGVAAVLWQRDRFRWKKEWDVPNLGIPNLRDCLGAIAAKIYDYPSEKLWMVGVTGTNGKTSCSQWITQSLNRAGRKTAVIGTLGNGFLDNLEPSANTTPDPVSLHSALAGYLKQGAKSVAIEVSSHGLAQGRLTGVEFDVALLTNLTRDHLDYHGNMRSYQAAKAKLFRFPSLKYAIVNLDDQFGIKLANGLKRKNLEVLGYGFNARPALDRRLPRVHGRNLVANADGVSFDVSSPWGSASLRSRLVGKFNASNLLGSLTTLLASDVALQNAVSALQRVPPPRGRMQKIGDGKQALVLVDYAHTPDALEKALSALRELLATGTRSKAGKARAHRLGNPKLICVFGCGGDRDSGKRPLMGAVASRLADAIVITTDNPRGEAPASIIDDILEGVKSSCHVIEDRATAIQFAVNSARTGDIVLIAGKGHEEYQEVMGKKFPFSDIKVAEAVLVAAGNRSQWK